MQAVLARVMGHIIGRDCRHVPGDVFGHELLNLDFFPAGGRVVLITGLPRDACLLCMGRVLTRSGSRVNPSYFSDKPRLVSYALWWSWCLHPVSRTNPRSYDKPRFAHALCGGLVTCRSFAPSRWTPLRMSSTR